MDTIKSAFLADMQRPWLWRGAAAGGLLVCGLIAASIVSTSMGSSQLDQSQAPDTGRVLLESSLSLMFMVASVIGSFSFTADFHTRSFHRRVLLFQRGPAFAGRAGSTAVVALGKGACIGLMFGLSGSFVEDEWQASIFIVGVFAAMAGLGTLWGFAIGCIIRNHLVSLFVVPLSLVLPAAFADRLGDFGGVLFPILATDWANHGAAADLNFGSLAGIVVWLACALGAAYWLFSKRDLS